MALPVTAGRADIVVQVEWDPVGAPGVYINWCGTTSSALNISNEVKETKVGDCDDWSAAVQTIREYSGQNITMTMDATWARSVYSKTLDWALNQKKLNVRIQYLLAQSGDVEFLDGLALLSELANDAIGNLEGDSVTERVSLGFSGVLTPTNKA